MVISLTITESELQKVASIPIEVYAETNIPASIFYTLDGTDPDTNSSIYIDKIILPTTKSYVVLKIFATNGTENSSIFSKIYGQNFVSLDISTSKIVNYPISQIDNQYPFGTSLPKESPILGQPAGLILDTGEIANVPDGYDADGNVIGFIDEGVNIREPLYSTTDRLGRTGRGIGDLPAETVVRMATDPPTSSSTNDKFFNPKAKIIIQRYDDTENSDILMLNRSGFSLQDIAKANGGSAYSYKGPGALLNTGGALRPQFNPTDKSLNYYYYDNVALRWIMSKERVPDNIVNDYSKAEPDGRFQGTGIVIKWLPFWHNRIV